jgi:hypothetical protein
MPISAASRQALRILGRFTAEVAAVSASIAVIGFAVASVRKSDRLDPFADVPTSGIPDTNLLLGETLTVPSRDIQGFAFPMADRRLVLAVPCSSCSWRSIRYADLRECRLRPLVLLVDQRSEDIPNDFKGHPSDVLVLNKWKGSDRLMNSMWQFAPIAFEIDAEGKIYRVQSGRDPLAFLASRGATQ